MEKITIVGGGNGAFAASADLTLRGNQVTLFELPQFAGGIKEVMERGGIEMESFAGNGLEGGFAKLYKITTDVKEALAESRSEERRVGKECRARWAVYREKKTDLHRNKV